MYLKLNDCPSREVAYVTGYPNTYQLMKRLQNKLTVDLPNSPLLLEQYYSFVCWNITASIEMEIQTN